MLQPKIVQESRSDRLFTTCAKCAPVRVPRAITGRLITISLSSSGALSNDGALLFIFASSDSQRFAGSIHVNTRYCHRLMGGSGVSREAGENVKLGKRDCLNLG